MKKSGVAWARVCGTTLLACVVFALLPAASLAQSEQLTWAAEIAYVTSRGDLWISALDGSNGRKLVDGPVLRPAWSPDGTRLAYIRALLASDSTGDHVEIIQADGKLLQSVKLAQRGLSRVRWDPDGTALYYIGSDQTIHRAHLDTGSDDNYGLSAIELDVAPDRTVQYIHGLHAEKMAVWEPGTQPWDPQPGGTPPLAIHALEFSRDAAWYAIAPGSFLMAQQVAQTPDARAPHRFVLFDIGLDGSNRPADAVTWLGDGSGVVFEKRGSDGQSYLWAAPLVGDRSTPVRLFAGRQPDGRPHPMARPSSPAPPRVLQPDITGDRQVFDVELRDRQEGADGIATVEVVVVNRTHPIWRVVRVTPTGQGFADLGLPPYVALPPCSTDQIIRVDCAGAEVSLDRIPLVPGNGILLTANGDPVHSAEPTGRALLRALWGGEAVWRAALGEPLPHELGLALGDAAVQSAQFAGDAGLESLLEDPNAAQALTGNVANSLLLLNFYQLNKAVEDKDPVGFVNAWGELENNPLILADAAKYGYKVSGNLLTVAVRIERVTELIEVMAIEKLAGDASGLTGIVTVTVPEQ